MEKYEDEQVVGSQPEKLGEGQSPGSCHNLVLWVVSLAIGGRMIGKGFFSSSFLFRILGDSSFFLGGLPGQLNNEILTS